jgi:colanic acid biosynthesis glycosyl transferase WcaI
VLWLKRDRLFAGIGIARRKARITSLKKIYVFYHFFHPDDVVSSVLFSELSSGLVDKGWEVTAFPCNRTCHFDSVPLPRKGEFEGVRIERIWRPAWRQSSGIGRILNAAWMISRWSMLAMQRRHKPDVVIVGTDPVLSVLIASVWRFFKPKTVLVNWCLDLYPEAAFADGLLSRDSILARLMNSLVKQAYRACDLVVDIGPCMRKLLNCYDSSRRFETIVPWAIEEPPQPLPILPGERKALFGDAVLGLLYSGSFGRAHSYVPILTLARLLKSDGICLTFSVRGNRETELRAALLPDDFNVRIVPFTAASNISARLASADIHVVTLREEWTGTVIPSKFFAALAAGRPVVFCGDRDSAIAQWIEQYDVGWVLTADNLPEVARSVQEYSKDPAAIQTKAKLCHAIYHAHFSRKIALRRWHEQLLQLSVLPLLGSSQSRSSHRLEGLTRNEG